MTTTDSPVRVEVGNVSAHITATDSAVLEWVRRYFGSWWDAELIPLGAQVADVHVFAEVDPTRYSEIASAVDLVPYKTTSYARKDMRLARTGGSITAYVDDVAYTVAAGSIGITGTDPAAVGSAASRLAREALRGLLAQQGWVLLHASAVVRDGRAYLAFGTKGAGKTATALQLVHATNGALLANDRLFARAHKDGTVGVLPWAAAGAVGLGLLDAAGWYNAVAHARDDLHPSTIPAVLEALARGDREPVRDAEREHKAQLFPDQFTSLLGIPLATSGDAAALLFPTIDPTIGGASIQLDGGQDIGVDDTFAGREEDRYPNVFGLRDAEPDTAHDAVFQALNQLPRWTLTLSHNMGSNYAVLGEIL